MKGEEWFTRVKSPIQKGLPEEKVHVLTPDRMPGHLASQSCSAIKFGPFDIGCSKESRGVVFDDHTRIDIAGALLPRLRLSNSAAVAPSLRNTLEAIILGLLGSAARRLQTESQNKPSGPAHCIRAGILGPAATTGAKLG